MTLGFTDPMEPFKRIFSRLLGPKELVDPSPKAQRLEYLSEGQVFDFSTLSSGEREVVNIAFDFQLRQPQDCIVFFDEPELHLHPELSYKLISTLREIGTRNQFMLSTHSPDIITSSLDQSVIFVSPPRVTDSGGYENQAIGVTESDDTHRALRLLGQSIGIVALGKRIVLIEGEHSSLDKQTYGSILGNQLSDLVLVPSGGKHVIESFDAIYNSILSKTIWGVDFFMLVDRDSHPATSPEELKAVASGRLRSLPGYHVENAFLDERVWAEAFSVMEKADSWLIDPLQVEAVLKELALSFVPYATALSVSNALRQAAGNIDVMPKGVHDRTLGQLQELFAAATMAERKRIGSSLDAARVSQLTEETHARLEASVQDGTGDWKRLVPGKPLLAAFAGRAGISQGRAKTLYISAATTGSFDPFGEVRRIFEDFTAIGSEVGEA